MSPTSSRSGMFVLKSLSGIFCSAIMGVISGHSPERCMAGAGHTFAAIEKVVVSHIRGEVAHVDKVADAALDVRFGRLIQRQT